MLKADIGSIGAVKRFVEAFRKSHHNYLSAKFFSDHQLHKEERFATLMCCCEGNPGTSNSSDKCRCSLFFKRTRTNLRHAFITVLFCPLLLQVFSSSAKASLSPDKPISQFKLQNWQSAQGLPQNSV